MTLPVRPPYETFQGAVCKGSLALGSGCGTCDKCKWERSMGYDQPHFVRRDTQRITREEILIEYAKLESKRGTCRRAKVGCVIAINGRPISTGYNGSPPGEPHCLDVGCEVVEGHCIRTIHAEANAICWAARRGVSTEGATLYTYGWKDGICHRCRKLAQSAGIVRIVEIPLET